MIKHDALRWLEKALDLAPHTLTGTERLRDVENWDSLSNLAFIAMLDKEFGVPVPAKKVAACQMVEDLLGLITAAAADRAA
jgi:acyl carrier protein